MAASRSRFVLPCLEMRKIRTHFKTQDSDVTKEIKIYPAIGDKLENVDGWFRVTIRFPLSPTYRDIEQTRAYTPQSLIGNAGGYVGLFIGCAIYDLPSLLMMAYTKITRFFSALKQYAPK